MSKTVNVKSDVDFDSICKSSTVVVADSVDYQGTGQVQLYADKLLKLWLTITNVVYADWCGPCKTIAPIFEQLSQSLSRPGKITFVKVNVDQQRSIAQAYNISAMPTFLILRNSHERSRIQGANGAKLQEAVKNLAAEAESIDSSGGASSSGTSGGARWLGASLPRGYTDITEYVDVRGLDLLNADYQYGSARTLFEGSKPSSKSGTEVGKSNRDWVESETDEQLMLFVPFNSTCRVHSLYITSFAPADDDDVMRPKTINLYTNSPHNLGFEEADEMTPTQILEVKPEDWNKETGTARLELRYVKFQKVSSLVVFIKDGEGEGEKCRVDRIRFAGESGEKKDMGKLEKHEHD
ncbi:MAG: Thioredoxin-like protein 1 [Chrysothrix sp. TS-e1954]|nr:MAG: Thioredoxin-like protein 1 [Chrysothrix sp. TS-e1954]